MSTDEKWAYLVGLDDSLLMGGAMLSEYTSALVRSADLAFVGDAFLACIITSLAVIETHLRSEARTKEGRLVDLISSALIADDLKAELHILRKCRNRWVHVAEPWEDESCEYTEESEAELEEVAKRCLVAMRRTIYANPWI
ncbi:MAG: hypothetical protein F9K30_16845 [Dechloromonas sp.]|nr:MAG: hypothetical protein F9K30_16845 [Dechloromonas sp.]